MKNIFHAILTIASIFAMSSCSSDDNDQSSSIQTNSITLKFDNIFNGSDIIPGVSYPNQANENLVFDRINYIISNIEFVNEDGSVYTIPKSESYFIIQELGTQTFNVTLPNIPTGSFSKIKFGIGVDQEQFLLGASGQGDFLAHAQQLDMLWNWTAGYKFLAIEGSFSTSTNTNSNFKVHTGQTGLAYNYATVELNLPELAFVRENYAPSIHIMVDVFQAFQNISLSEQSQIMGGQKVTTVTQNVPNMFSVHHVHNF